MPEAPLPLPPALRLPVFAAPMFLISGPELVIAACKAGIIGAFPTPNARPIEQLDEWMSRITAELAAHRTANPDAVIGPWCANLMTHSSNARLPQDLALLAKHRPPLVVTALGSPKPAIEVVHGYGGKVFADVTTLKLARKAVEAGADGLACIAAGAGGHTGALSPFAFVSAVREFFGGPVVLGGGIADGRGIAGAIAAGADYVYMGTRFIAAEESMASAQYKAMLAAASADDLLVSAAITGTPASWLKPSLVANGMDPANMPETPTRNYDSGQSMAGKRWSQVWSAGQGVGQVRGTEPAAAIVARLEVEYAAARARFQAFAGACP
ncbi:MAG: NAD(P)H-dependent flavin oxidoreductase [Pararhodobacter sp.]